jgi:hypothetical protein
MNIPFNSFGSIAYTAERRVVQGRRISQLMFRKAMGNESVRSAMAIGKPYGIAAGIGAGTGLGYSFASGDNSPVRDSLLGAAAGAAGYSGYRYRGMMQNYYNKAASEFRNGMNSVK